MRKGIELPVNVLVIVAVAVIVLLGIIALFMGGFGSSAATLEQRTAFNEHCAQIITDCDATSYPDQTEFVSACVAIYGSGDFNTCKVRCGCPSTGATTDCTTYTSQFFCESAGCTWDTATDTCSS